MRFKQLILASIFVLSLCSCSNVNDEISTSEEVSKSTEKYNEYETYKEKDNYYENKSHYPLSGGNYYEGDDKPNNDFGSNLDCFHLTTDDIYFIKEDDKWYKTDYTLNQKFISSTNKVFYQLSNNKCYLEKENEISNVNKINNDSISFDGRFKQSNINDEYSFSLDFNYSDFFSLDNETYHDSLADLGLVLSNSVYENQIVNIDGKDYLSRNEIPSLIFGKDLRNFTFDKDEFSIDISDTLSVLVFHVNYLDTDNTYKEILFVDFEGTANEWEWYSDFDFGVEDSIYEDRTGTHPEWQNKKNHKGFDIALNRFIPFLNEYIRENIISSASKALFITGHSRGGALANLLGSMYASNNEYKTFTYTFAACNCTLDKKECPSIFNILNDDDSLPGIPMEKVLGFKRNGKDIFVNEEDFLPSYSRLFPNNEFKSNDKDNISDYFASLATTPNEFFKIEKDSAHKIFAMSSQRKFASENDATQALNFDLTLVNACGPKTMFETEVLKNLDNTYSYHIYTCPAAFFYYYSSLLANFGSFEGNSAFFAVYIIFSENISSTMFDLSLQQEGFLLNHKLSTYYAILDSLK